MTRKRIWLAALVLGMLIPGACDKAPQSTDEEQARQRLLEQLQKEVTVSRNLTVSSSKMGGKTMKYSVILPGGYDNSKTYPVLYLLHGYGDDNNSWMDKGKAAGIAQEYFNKDGVSMVIVMPDGLTTFYTDGWGGNWESYFHGELIPEVEKKFHGNGKRAVAGLSMGGYGTLYNVLNHPDKFTYGYAMSPATSYGSVSLESLVEAQSSASVFPGITVESGTEDFTVSIASVREFVQMLNDHGVKNEFIERSGGHDWNFWPVCLEKALKKIGDSFK
ncbi:MAG: hypothetical protein IJ651_05220 [Bacteroidales bacterium]|nr:hypothetical protein [Bacteroidales bacterium]